jgi:predicted alpha/beta-hydrolase family hydrolase
VLVGYPLHPAGRPSVERADHLVMIRTPMLLLQGTRDTLADLALIRAVVSGHAGPIQLQVLDGADHSFHLPAGAGRSDGAVLEELTGKMVGWMRSCRP